MSRRDQYTVSVSIDGIPLGVFDSQGGGKYGSEDTKYKPGGMVPEVSLGGSKTTDNVTVGRLFRLDRDLPLVPTIKAKVGSGSVTISKQSMDVNRNPYGTPDVYTGILLSAQFPEPDSTANEAAIMMLEVSVAGS